MCNLAVQELPWMVPCSGTYANAKERALGLSSEIEPQHGPVVQITVYGGDKFKDVKDEWCTSQGRETGAVTAAVFDSVPREGNAQNQTVLELLKQKPLNSDTFILLERDTSSQEAPVSSTSIRRALVADTSAARVPGLPQSVLAYMQESHVF
jgi:hypothetical protein